MRRALAPLSVDGEHTFESHSINTAHETLRDFDILTLLDGHVASTLRIRFDSADRNTMEISELTIKRQFALELPGLPYLALRAAWLAAEHYGCDLVLMNCRSDQQAFYTRVFGFEALASPRKGAGEPISRLALAFPQAKERVEGRYPMFRSTEAERRSIFGKPQSQLIYQQSAQSANC